MTDFSTQAMRNVEKFLQLMLFCCKISFVAIYAVLSRNLFCCDLRAFVWRKVEPKVVPVEKKDKYQVWLVGGFVSGGRSRRRG